MLSSAVFFVLGMTALTVGIAIEWACVPSMAYYQKRNGLPIKPMFGLQRAATLCILAGAACLAMAYRSLR